MPDGQMTLQDLKNRLKKFRDDRDWSQFHDPKNLAEAISIEAGELMELFLWKTKQEIAQKMEADPEYKQKMADELADVFAYVIAFSNATNIDLSDACIRKYEKNEKKYPIDKARGNAKKYTEL